MTVGSTPSTRVGEAERTEAQRLLQGHLDAGRLQLVEFVERFGGAADAVTAADIAALFADLPAPHPTLPAPPRARTRRSIVIVGAVAALVLAGSLGVAIGRGQATPSPGAVAPAAASPASGPTTPPPPDAPTIGPAAVPDGVTVRRTTGPGLITLRPSSGVDLDDVTDPAWNVGTGCCSRDVGFAADSSRLSTDDGRAVVNGPPEFATCFHAAAYTHAAIELGSLRPGETICVRTDGHRFALVTIVDVDAQAVAFGTTVWDPPVPP